MPDERYAANPDVTCRREADGAALFNPDTSALRAINAVGTLIWQALARPCTQAEIVARVLESCPDAPADQVAVDVAAFLGALQRSGFAGRVWEEGDPFPNPVPSTASSPASGPADVGQPWTAPPLSLAAAGPDAHTDLRFYHGNSMLGTFHPGEHLVSEPVPIAALRPGDVVIYRCRGDETDDVVHRVVAVTPGGLVTRGDNNPQVDTGLVTQDDLVGRVTHALHGDRVRRVWGGRWGLLYARTHRAWMRARRLGGQWVRRLGRRTYRWLRTSGRAGRWWRPRITRVVVAAGEVVWVKYASGRRTVACWWPGTGRFSCRKPYDLIVCRPGCDLDREVPVDGSSAPQD